MANLTITLDDELLRRARMRALEQDTSVNALLRDYLEAFAATGATARELRRLELLTETDRYVADLIAEVGPPDAAQRKRARRGLAHGRTD